ncbi:GMC oxidoreductase [Hysterangium stoloniferum]|nr:GMC oxidoreductase [Hysterangium stoloniferum]
MGSLFSSPFITDPSVYATKVEAVKTTSSEIRTYDYVIIGGGPAACVLAHRLTEDPTVMVLVIEAGKGHKGHLNSQIPAGFGKLFKSAIDWNYSTTTQANAGDRSLYWPSGKVLGGGSMINAMMYQRPTPDDIEEWAKLGATGWTWDEFKKYLLKAEKYTLNPERPNAYSALRGKAGLWLTRHPERAPVSTDFVNACDNIGIPKTDDISGTDGALCATHVSAWIDPKGQRSSVAHAYLTDAVLQRPNLTIAIETTVTRIIFSESSETPEAVGVELTKGFNAPHYQVNARREVLCCAGAIKTPQILTLSGIGPKSELNRLGIPAVKVLDAVGKNLHDHLVSTVTYRAKPGTSMEPLLTPIGGILPLLQWLSTGRGPFTSLVGQAFAFCKTTNQSLPMDQFSSNPTKVVDASAGNASPDLELILAPVGFVNHGFTPAPPGHEVVTLAVVLLRPMSSGSITLKTRNLWDGANIDPNYLSEDNDIKGLVKGIRLSMRIARTSPLVENLLLADDVENSDDYYFPGHAHPDKVTDEALENFIRKETQTLYHPMCTARIGLSPEDSVVDQELRVHGVSRLRIIDASVFPAPFAGHTCVPVVGLAEKAADMLKSTAPPRS